MTFKILKLTNPLSDLYSCLLLQYDIQIFDWYLHRQGGIEFTLLMIHDYLGLRMCIVYDLTPLTKPTPKSVAQGKTTN